MYVRRHYFMLYVLIHPRGDVIYMTAFVKLSGASIIQNGDQCLKKTRLFLMAQRFSPPGTVQVQSSGNVATLFAALNT